MRSDPSLKWVTATVTRTRRKDNVVPIGAGRQDDDQPPF